MKYRVFITLVLILISFQSLADRTINSVTLSPNTVDKDATVNVSISVTGSGNDKKWYSTGYTIDGGGLVCKDETADTNSASIRSASFDITAPSSSGEFEFLFYAYKGANCTDSVSLSYEVELVVVSIPTDITLDPYTIYDTEASLNAVIGNLSIVDAGASNSVSLHTYNGGTDTGSCLDSNVNWIFNIDNNVLSIGNASGSTLAVGDYNICVKTDDNKLRKTLTVTVVENLSGVSTNISLSSNTIYDYEAFEGIEIGTLSVTDPDDSSNVILNGSDSNSLVGSCPQGAGDNWRFLITNNVLSIGNDSNSSVPVGSYTICVKTDDDYYRQNLTVEVIEPNQSPTFFTISNAAITTTNATADSEVGVFSPTDEGSAYTFTTYSIHNSNEDVNVGECTGGFTDNQYFTTVDTTLVVEDWVTSLDERDYNICIKATRDDGVKYLRNFTVSVTDDSAPFVPGSCPAAGNQVSDIIINEVNHKNKHNWVEFYLLPGVIVDFADWTLVSKGSGNIDDQYTLCSSSCEFSGGTNGAFVIYGEIPETGAPTNFIQNDDFAVHNTLQELLLLNNSDKLIHYLRYANNASSANYDYTDCPVEYTTDVLGTGNDKTICAETDGTLPGAEWSGACSGTPGESNAEPVLSTCPDISAYNLIFDEDFSETTYQLSNTWSEHNFNKLDTNVWPNDNILIDEGERQDLVYLIENQALKIGGDVSNSGNNEYGVILHDVNSQGYSPSTIDEYAIDTRISAFADQNGNNDVGVVFGYQGESDFYLLRWTKVGVDNVNDTSFPGNYRSLDLLQIEDGVPTVLTSDSNFYETDELSVQITVDADGISICINGSEVLTYETAQPKMHNVGLFSYDNDYQGGFQISSFKIYCKDCTVTDIIGWWPMEDDFDDLVAGNNLTAYGDILFESSNVAKTVGNNSTCKYAVMDGQSYGRVDDSGNLNTEELAVSAWVYPTSYPGDNNDTNGNNSLMAISSKDVNYEFHINANGNLYWWWQNQNGNNRTLTSADTVPLNTWSHVAISYKYGEQRMYINGDLQASSNRNELPKQSPCDYYVGADVATGSCNIISGRNFIGDLDEVRIYGRYLEQSEIQEDSNYLRSCGLINYVDHYRITHPENNLSCQSTTITVQACADENCAAVVAPNISGNVQRVVNGNISTISALNLSNSSQQLEFNYTSLDTINLALNSMYPSANFDCYYESGSASNCDITYNQFGYIVTAQDIRSTEAVSDPNNLVTIQAVEAVADDPSICEPTVVANQIAAIDFTYVDHPDNHNLENLYISTDDSTYSSVVSGNGIEQTLNFNNPEAKAEIYVRYGDAGTLQLSVTDPNGEIIGGSDSFNVIPYSILLEMTDDAGLTMGAVNNETHYAGQSFNISISARNVEGNITENYRPGNLELKPVMSYPLTSAGADQVVFNYGGNTPITLGNNETWVTDALLVFSNTGYSSSVASFDNVGSFNVDIKDSDYLGYIITSDTDGDDISEPKSAGRFTPAYFTFENTPDTEIPDTHGTFTYFGESLDFVSAPIFSYVAKTYKNVTATNYEFNTSDFDFLTGGYTEDTSYSPVPYPSTAIENIDLTEQGIMKFSLVSPFLYQKSAIPTAELTSVIKLSFSTDGLKDADLVGYDSSGINNDTPSYEDFTAVDNTFNLRYGRLFLENAFGNETSDLKIEMTLQYYNGSKFVTNTDDSDTAFSGFNISITEGGEPTSYTSKYVGTTFEGGKTASNEGLFIDATNAKAELLINITDLPDWLNVDWDGDGDIDSEDNVSSTVIFGSYRGNDRIIYKRER